MTYLFLVLFTMASAKPSDEDAYEYDEDDEDSWSASNAGPPTRMLHVKMPNSKPQKDEVWSIHQSNLTSSKIWNHILAACSSNLQLCTLF